MADHWFQLLGKFSLLNIVTPANSFHQIITRMVANCSWTSDEPHYANVWWGSFADCHNLQANWTQFFTSPCRWLWEASSRESATESNWWLLYTSTVPSWKLNRFWTTDVSSLILLPFSPSTFCVLVAKMIISVRMGVTRTSTPLYPSSASSLLRNSFSSALNTPSATNCWKIIFLVKELRTLDKPHHIVLEYTF